MFNAVNVKSWVPKKTDVKLLAGSKGHSYQCSTLEKVMLSNDVTVDLKNIQIQPFMVSKGKFSKGKKSSFSFYMFAFLKCHLFFLKTKGSDIKAASISCLCLFDAQDQLNTFNAWLITTNKHGVRNFSFVVEKILSID